MKIKLLIIAALILGGFNAFAQQFLPAKEAFIVEDYQRTENDSVKIEWKVADGYYLYKSKIKANSNGDSLNVKTPQGVTVNDVNFGMQEVFKDNFEMTVKGVNGNTLVIEWQGCAEAGLCYPSEATSLKLTEANAATSQSEDLAFFDTLENDSFLVIVGSFLGIGLLLAFTPCSLPMLPVLANIVLSGHKRSAFKLSGVYTLSMAAVYALAGASTALAGANLQAIFQSPLVLLSFALVLLVFASSMFGLFEVTIPQAITSKITMKSSSTKGGSVTGAFLLGVFSALIVGPCMTAPLAGALLFIGETGNALTGATALFALGVGMGLPLMVVCVLGRKALPKPGAWMNYVKGLLGAALVITAVYFISKVLSVNVAILIGALSFIVIGCLAFTLNKARVSAMPFVLSGVMVAVSLFMQLPEQDQRPSDMAYFTAVQTPSELESQIKKARELNQKIFIDVYADWCASCVVMDDEVFGSPKAKAALTNYRAVKVDVTDMSDSSKELLNNLNVLGPPTLIILDESGYEIREKRITGEVGLAEFVSAVRVGQQTPDTPAELFESQSQL